MFLFREFSLPLKHEIRPALRSVYGVGWYKAIFTCSRLGFATPYFLDNLNLYFFAVLHFFLKGFHISDARIKRRVILSINRLFDSGCYRGKRHQLCLPVRGQRTRTNASTQRSKRIITISS